MAEEKRIPPLTVPVLAILLAIAAFLAGTFWMKIRSLQGGESAEVAQASPIPGGEEEQILGAEAIAKIEAGGMTRGEEGAPITIVEFSEYQCPFCSRYFEEAYQEIWENYGDQIRYIFHDYPLPFHQHAQKTAEAARCAGDQGQYWEMHDLLFTNQAEWSEKEEVETDLEGYAETLGLDLADFSTCLDSGKHTQAVEDDFDLGQGVGVNGTPTFFINGQKLVGAQPFEAFKTIIDAELGE